MKSFAFSPIRLAVVHLLILFALTGLSGAQKKSWPTLDKSRTLSVSTENDLVIVRDVQTGEVVSMRPAGAQAPVPTLTFQTLAAPSGATSTYAQGINSNGTQISGGYYPASANGYGLAYSGSDMTVLTYPGAAYTAPRGINDTGEVVGGYGPGGSASTAFTYENGTYKAVSSKSLIAIANGISDSGAIVGMFVPANRNNYVSILVNKGVHTKITFPGSITTSVGGVNQSGEVVGTYGNDSGFFGFTDVNGTYTSFQVPGAKAVNTASISNNGNIAGTYQDSNNIQHGYVLINGVFTNPIDYPGATSTQVYGIDNAGDIVGTYYQGSDCTLSGQNCGFVATAQ